MNLSPTINELTPSITVTNCLMAVLVFWKFQIWHVYDLELNIKLWNQITCHVIYYVHGCHCKIHYVINQYSTDMDPFGDQYSIIGGRDDCHINRDHHCWHFWTHSLHRCYMSIMVAQLTGNSTCSTVYLFRQPIKKLLLFRITGFVRGLCCWPADIHQWPEDSPHKGSVMQKLFLCDNIFMIQLTFDIAYIQIQV